MSSNFEAKKTFFAKKRQEIYLHFVLSWKMFWSLSSPLILLRITFSRNWDTRRNVNWPIYSSATSRESIDRSCDLLWLVSFLRTGPSELLMALPIWPYQTTWPASSCFGSFHSEAYLIALVLSLAKNDWGWSTGVNLYLARAWRLCRRSPSSFL